MMGTPIITIGNFEGAYQSAQSAPLTGGAGVSASVGAGAGGVTTITWVTVTTGGCTITVIVLISSSVSKVLGLYVPPYPHISKLRNRIVAISFSLACRLCTADRYSCRCCAIGRGTRSNCPCAFGVPPCCFRGRRIPDYTALNLAV